MNIKTRIRFFTIVTIIAVVSLLLSVIRLNHKKNAYMANEENFLRSYINNHQITFAHYISSINSQYLTNESLIEDHVIIINIIEDLNKSLLYYEVAKDLQNKNNYGELLFQSLINDYIFILKEYSAWKTTPEDTAFKKDIVQIMNDLLIIGKWLLERNSNNQLELHTDEDFYKNVYPLLSNDVKLESDYQRKYDASKEIS